MARPGLSSQKMLPMLPTIPKKRKTADNNVKPTLRVIELELFPPTSRRYPRFNFEEISDKMKPLGAADEQVKEQQLNTEEQAKEQPCVADGPEQAKEQLATAEKQEQAKAQLGAVEHTKGSQIEDIVRRLEAKYGTQSISMSSSAIPPSGREATKKSKKSSKKDGIKFAAEDVVDKGFGYVQEDDFIDDTEAYDEWVPTTMDTAKRGHYVNKGPLEFRQVDLESSTSSSDQSAESSSSSDEVGDGTAKKSAPAKKRREKKVPARPRKNKKQSLLDNDTVATKRTASTAQKASPAVADSEVTENIATSGGSGDTARAIHWASEPPNPKMMKRTTTTITEEEKRKKKDQDGDEEIIYL